MAEIVIDTSSIAASEEEGQWTIFVEQIFKGNVIPVIGGDMQTNDGKPVEKKIIDAIAADCGITENISGFSQLVSNKSFKAKYDRQSLIYTIVKDVIEKSRTVFEPSPLLMKLLGTKKFPFVITTSFCPMVENTLREVYGDVKVLAFTNDARYNDDIDNDAELKKPVAYHIFGKYDDAKQNFVLTDMDMLSFSRSWLAKTDSGSNAKPAILARALADKYLLVLGCNYQDWLFRFLWFALKENRLAPSSSSEAIGMLAEKRNENDELIAFLNNSNIFTQIIDIEGFVEKLLSKMNEYEAVHEKPSKFDNPEIGADVFISYSRSDSDIVEILYNKLSDRGLNVWYDRRNLILGDDFRKEIKKAIRTAKLFVPVLSANIRKEYKEEHVYRTEWNWAVEFTKNRGYVKYIEPICEKNFDLYDEKTAIPDEIQKYNGAFYDPDNLDKTLDELTDQIMKYVKEADNE